MSSTRHPHPPPAHPAANVPAAERRTVVGSGIRVNGRVSGEEDLEIEGHIEGAIELSETVFVQEGGVVVAEVRARDVVVSGVLVGNVTADDSVTLMAGAKLVGDISAPRIIIADGAAFCGNVAMGGHAPPRRERTSTTARTRPSQDRSPSRAPPTRRDTESGGRAFDGDRGEGSAPRIAAIAAQRPTGEEEVTVVVRHAALRNDEVAGAKKKVKKAPPRARVPKPGKRRVNRRS